MVPHLAKTGSSFKGVGAYLLHDKDAQSDERVVAVETLNLPTDDPKRAVAHMIDTAVHAKELGAQSGSGARGSKKPVYHYSLSWPKPEDGEQTPTIEEQMQAARDSLKALGLEEHQAMLVIHNDTDHPHIHIVVNLIHPVTGRKMEPSHGKKKLSLWAEDYERTHGKIYCEERVKNNARRRKGERVNHKAEPKAQTYAWKKAESDKLWDEYRKERDKADKILKGQLDALCQQREERYHLRREEIRELYRPKWRDVYREHGRELAAYDADFRVRFNHARQLGESRIMAFAHALLGDQVNRRLYVQAQERARAYLSDQQKGRISDASREINKAYRYDRDKVIAAHEPYKEKRLSDARSQSKELWGIKDESPDNKATDDFANTNTANEDTIKKTLQNKRSRSRGRRRKRGDEPDLE